jgi:hypothetical protein
MRWLARMESREGAIRGSIKLHSRIPLRWAKARFLAALRTPTEVPKG